MPTVFHTNESLDKLSQEQKNDLAQNFKPALTTDEIRKLGEAYLRDYPIKDEPTCCNLWSFFSPHRHQEIAKTLRDYYPVQNSPMTHWYWLLNQYSQLGDENNGYLPNGMLARAIDRLFERDFPNVVMVKQRIFPQALIQFQSNSIAEDLRKVLDFAQNHQPIDSKIYKVQV